MYVAHLTHERIKFCSLFIHVYLVGKKDCGLEGLWLSQSPPLHLESCLVTRGGHFRSISCTAESQLGLLSQIPRSFQCLGFQFVPEICPHQFQFSLPLSFPHLIASVPLYTPRFLPPSLHSSMSILLPLLSEIQALSFPYYLASLCLWVVAQLACTLWLIATSR